MSADHVWVPVDGTQYPLQRYALDGSGALEERVMLPAGKILVDTADLVLATQHMRYGNGYSDERTMPAVDRRAALVRCRCSGGSTGEDIDVNPACPEHGDHAPAPVGAASWTGEEPF